MKNYRMVPYSQTLFKIQIRKFWLFWFDISNDDPWYGLPFLPLFSERDALDEIQYLEALRDLKRFSEAVDGFSTCFAIGIAQRPGAYMLQSRVDAIQSALNALRTGLDQIEI